MARDSAYIVGVTRNATNELTGLDVALRFERRLARRARTHQPTTYAAPAWPRSPSAAVDKVQVGEYPKKALLIVTDGNDTFSDADILRVRKVVRQAEVLIYAIGIEGRAYPFPVLRDCGELTPQSSAPLNVSALRTMTDDSGGHTELIEFARGLDGATSRIAGTESSVHPWVRVNGQEGQPLAQHQGRGG